MTRARRRSRQVGGSLLLAWVLVVMGVAAPAAPAHALTGDEGLLAIATVNGIEVGEPSGDASDLRVLIPNEPGVILQEPAWSPRGDRIAFTRWGAHVSMWVARDDGTDAHQISAPGEDADRAAWSPDGRIAYVRDGSTVVIADADGRHAVDVDPRKDLGRPNIYLAGRPAWTADGRLVLLLLEPGVMGRSPFIADGDGTHLRPLTYPDGGAVDLASLSFDWQFSSTGLVAYAAYLPEDDRAWVHFSTFDGRHIVEAWGAATSDLGGREQVALSPLGQRAVVTWPDHFSPGRTSISFWDVDLTSPTDSIHGTGGFDIAGTVVGMDWQPRCSITGTPGDDVLVGTPGPDLICGLGGHDVISGLGGNDVIFALSGDDVVRGGLGNDVIVGGRGIDELRGGRGLDLIRSRRDGHSPDRVLGGPGYDVCLHDRADSASSC